MQVRNAWHLGPAILLALHRRGRMVGATAAGLLGHVWSPTPPRAGPVARGWLGLFRSFAHTATHLPMQGKMQPLPERAAPDLPGRAVGTARRHGTTSEDVAG